MHQVIWFYCSQKKKKPEEPAASEYSYLHQNFLNIDWI